ncbi:pre-toxin TG domain-containing protein [Nocardia salmonicida]|uniref:pre-toxin TG domain-containing protein n=1 Tax=Nocardia salmonicida TaxID=53431 RepID=UPI0033E7269B
MSVNIQAYRRAVNSAEMAFQLALADGKESAFGVALRRVTWEIMHTELTTAPNSVLVWERMPPQPPYGSTGADAWTAAAEKKALERISPRYGSPEQYERKSQEYVDLSLKMLRWGQVGEELIVDKQRGKQYLILGADPLVGKVMKIVADELFDWFRKQPNSRELIDQPARAGLNRMFSERPDLVALIRVAVRLPLDVEISGVPVDRPAFVEATELAIGLVPVVGNMVAAYEAWSGADLFGYRLSDVERAVLAASVLLPSAGRLVKSGGRAIYTEARLVLLYGRDAAAWSRTVGASARGLAERPALSVVEEAARLLRVEGKITGAILKKSADVVPRLVKGATKLTTTVDSAVIELFRELSQAHAALKLLDEHAIERILAKGPNTDHLKGQVLEELIESRIAPWLSTREGGFALGITMPAGKRLEFIPGHLVRDTTGRQISDGLLAFRDGEHGKQLVIVAVFEAKAGKSAARELSLKGGSISSLTKAERRELRANAKDVWREQREEALAAGKPFKKALNEVEKEYALSELGGQVRRDIERLSDAQIRVGTETFKTTLSATRTKFFGILPRDVRAATIEKQLKESGFSYEIIGADIKAKDLAAIGEKLKPLAEKLADAAP